MSVGLFCTRKNQTIILISLAISVVNVLVFYGIQYSQIQQASIPVGWDTPSYVTNIQLVKDGQLAQVLKETDYVNFMYYFFSSLIPASPIHIEIYLPIGLAILSIFSFGLFSHLLTRNAVATSATMLILSTSFALFRISSDLHSQLLGIVLMFFAFFLYLRPIPRGRIWSIVVPILVLVSSFTHFENSFFLLVIFSAAWAFIYKTKQLGQLFKSLFIPVVPSAILYIVHIFNIEYFPPQLQITNDPISYGFLLLSIGAFLPLVIAGIVSSFYLVSKQYSVPENRNVLFFIYFTLIWFGLCLVLFRQSYFTDSFYSFSYRAAVFLPIPFLGAIPFLLLDPKLFRRINSPKYAIISIAVVISLCLYNFSTLFEHEVDVGAITYLSADSYKQLSSLSRLNLTGTPVFILYPKSGEVSPGGMSTYIDHWMSVYFGPHYTYLGFVEAFLSGKETPFTDPYSKYYSYSFNKDLNRANVSSDNISSETHPIILMEDFYDVEKLQNSSRYQEIDNGIYVYKGNPNQRVDYSLSSVSVDPRGWYMTEYQNQSMVETYIDVKEYNPLKIVLPLVEDSCYLFKMKYLDGSEGIGFKVVSKSETVHLRYYEGTGTIKEDSFRYCVTDKFTEFLVEPISHPMYTVETYFSSIGDTLTVQKVS